MAVNRNIPISLPVTGEEEWQAVKEPIMNGWLTTGPKVQEFQQLFAEKHQVKHAIAVTSATTALHLALVALDIKAGDEVIVPAFTWVSTANVVVYQGATPVFVDIDIQTFNIDPDQLKNKITNRTKAIIPVHLFGLCADMDRIKEVAGDIPLVEDAACASGAAYNGTFAGGLGDVGCFSFHPRKSVTTGEGGMLTTNNDELADRLTKLRNHGASISEEQRHHGPKPYILPDFDNLGFNYRMTDLQGAVGVVQIQKLDKFINERAEWARYYNNELGSFDWLDTPEYENKYKHGWQSYVTYVHPDRAGKDRNTIMEFLQEKGISTRPGTHAPPFLGYYQKRFGTNQAEFPNAWNAQAFSMALPLHNRMTPEDYYYIIDMLKQV